ncbi:interleukin-17C-like [Brachionichthys hirsutus]|uniref:interleukin-17C-like n=1 Tax=Brachionichthys hirsutus TaxID=412623 RepID=UPI0036046CEB
MMRLSLASLLIFGQHASSSCAAAGGCLSGKRLSNLADRFQRRYWDKLALVKYPPPPRDARTCAQLAQEMSSSLNSRAVSPWKYSINRDVDRIPHEIAFAECICQGCIINQHEDLKYNSVPVFAPLMVLKKTRCGNDPSKYEVKNDFINVPLACTCVVPKYVK